MKFIVTFLVLLCFVFSGCLEDRIANTFQVDKPGVLDFIPEEAAPEEFNLLVHFLVYVFDIPKLRAEQSEGSRAFRLWLEWRIYLTNEILYLVSDYYNKGLWINKDNYIQDRQELIDKYNLFKIPENASVIDPCGYDFISDYLLKIDNNFYSVNYGGYEEEQTYSMFGQIMPYYNYCVNDSRPCNLIGVGLGDFIEENEIIDIKVFIITSIIYEKLDRRVYNQNDGFSCRFKIKRNKIRKL